MPRTLQSHLLLFVRYPVVLGTLQVPCSPWYTTSIKLLKASKKGSSEASICNSAFLSSSSYSCKTLLAIVLKIVIIKPHLEIPVFPNRNTKRKMLHGSRAFSTSGGFNHKRQFKRDFHCRVILRASTGMYFNGSTCVK